MKKIILIALFAVLLAMPNLALATAGDTKDFGQTNLGKALGGTAYKDKTDLPTSIGAIISGVLALAGTIFLILTVYGGITWMIAMGNSDKVERAKEIITAAVIGGAITASAYAITFFVMSRITTTSGGNQGMGHCDFTNEQGSRKCASAPVEDCNILGGTWSPGLCRSEGDAPHQVMKRCSNKVAKELKVCNFYVKEKIYFGYSVIVNWFDVSNSNFCFRSVKR